MTIRDHLKRRTRWLVLGVLGPPVVLIVGLVSGAAAMTPQVALALVGVVILSGVLALFLLRCPKCNGNLNLLMAHFGPLAGIGKTVRFCPFCGVSLDEPVGP